MAGDTGRERKNNRETGSHYERLAGAYLEQEGYEILEYNYRCKTGEIDIIAKEAGYLVFCEVKYRASVSIENHEVTLYRNAFDYTG